MREQPGINLFDLWDMRAEQIWRFYNELLDDAEDDRVAQFDREVDQARGADN